ncbi:MAG: restriction endonuclease [Acetobacteraceae bacterium]|nr:restriction endonuclease [Acetobacteraceae bacterium]
MEDSMQRGSLFTRFFLEDGIRETDEYRALAQSEIDAFASTIRTRWATLETIPNVSESETEEEFIFPLIEHLGWRHLRQQTPGRSRQDIVDALLFRSDTDRNAALPLPSDRRFARGAAILENKTRDAPLDRANTKGETPALQLLRYLRRADTETNGVLCWGILTNARFWRLHYAQARSPLEGFIEFDLPALVSPLPPPVPAEAPRDHWLRVVYLLFRREALVPAGPQSRTFLDEALTQGRRYEARVTKDLSRTVFDRAFPALVAALGRADPAARPDDAAWREAIRQAALRILYRLLFLLYAEDRDLLPIRNPGYEPYALRQLRVDAAEVADNRRTLSARAATWWPNLKALFAAIAAGDPAMGLPPYNGGLFDDSEDEILARIALPDAVLAALIDDLSREGEPLARRWINFRDLSVQHLGSIYEGLLERDVVADEAGALSLRPNAYARKNSGSYYTPDELVRLILRRAVGPLLAERREAFRARADDLGADTRRKAERLADLRRLDPAEAFLTLRICDPAMGSGHFLVTLVDYLAEETLTAMAESPSLVAWADYRSPLLDRIEAIRSQIQAQAAANSWPIRDDQLDDKHIVRRIILKRCIYGVDLNPMAVELAKLSLWLHSFTVGAPLSFLDHHLRCGDSLFGEFVHPVEADLRARYGLAMSQAVVAARHAAAGMAIVENATDADIAEVHASATAFQGVEEATYELRRFLDFYHAARWLPGDTPAEQEARKSFLGGAFGPPTELAAGTRDWKLPRSGTITFRDERRRTHSVSAATLAAAAIAFRGSAGALALERRFLHWEVAFPGVWDDWESATPRGGFHAVIGNPPWDRMKLQEVEWFADRVPEIARATRAADRRRAIARLRERNDDIPAQFQRAAWVAEAAVRVARDMGAYPLLSGGDVNLYSLFVERAARLVRPDGMVGLLVPSGIAADLGAAPFFRSLSTTGRLAALLDFENRRTRLGLEHFFPDVDSRFKYCTIAFGGPARTFLFADCAFFQDSATAAEASAFPLTPADFAAVNPNTGTAPVFRSRRDAEITRAIYARLPVLVDRRTDPPAKVWPIRYATMFHMTNDSDKFVTIAELRQRGAWQRADGLWQTADDLYRPLNVGRSFHQFDHRYASIMENTENLHNPFSGRLTGELEHADPAYITTPQYYVADSSIEWPIGLDWVIAYRDIARPTDIRTVISTIVPRSAFGNTAPILLPDDDMVEKYKSGGFLLTANLSSLVLDYVARQKVQSTHVNLYILEQLPILPPSDFCRPFGSASASQIVRNDVLALTYTSNDIAAFAADLGYAGPPFRWNPEDRLRRRARLDALFFLLYGLDRDAADYVLSTFPIVRQQEEQAYGRFRSRDLILNWMAALAAGHPDADIAG